jgi:hypothetical protein
MLAKAAEHIQFVLAANQKVPTRQTKSGQDRTT